MTRTTLRFLAPLVLLACSERSLSILGPDADETGGNDAYPGEVFATCDDARDYDEELSCFHPAGEPGYCAMPCVADDQCEAINPSLGNLACIYLQPANANICAIRCADGDCPLGMRCEAVDLGGDAARLCF